MYILCFQYQESTNPRNNLISLSEAKISDVKLEHRHQKEFCIKLM